MTMKLRNILATTALLFALPMAAATFTTNGPRTTNNDDSCDIALLPAATLLIPYFEVDVTAPAGNGQTTIVSVTNTSHLPQAISMTLWTDYGYPVLSFRFYLTGYDVQSINLYDVLRRGMLAPDSGTGSDVSPVGELSGSTPTQDFDNPRLDESSCIRLPIVLPNVYVTRMIDAFTKGSTAAIGTIAACERIGGVHTNAVGYVTVDLVNACTPSLPTESAYFSSEISYDNVLMGDYLQVDGSNDFAQGSPAVHIRAIPEGGTPTSRQTSPSFVTNLERTFYRRLTTPQFSDARQPLPSTFAARWIAGGPDSFNTFFKVWREVPNGSGRSCSTFAPNATLAVADTVVFDEAENVSTVDTDLTLPATSILAASPMPNGAIAGWTYFNLDRSSGDRVAAQNWVTVSMRAQNRFSADFEASALGNGCSPEDTTETIGPAQ